MARSSPSNFDQFTLSIHNFSEDESAKRTFEELNLIPTKDYGERNARCLECSTYMAAKNDKSMKIGWKLSCENCRNSYDPLQGTLFANVTLSWVSRNSIKS